MWSYFLLINTCSRLTLCKMKSKSFNHITQSCMFLYPQISLLSYPVPYTPNSLASQQFPENTRWAQACDLHVQVVSSPTLISVHLVITPYRVSPEFKDRTDHSSFCESHYSPALQQETYSLLLYSRQKVPEGRTMLNYGHSFAHQDAGAWTNISLIDGERTGHLLSR